MGRHYFGVQVVSTVVSQSKQALVLCLFAISVCTLVLSTVLFIIEDIGAKSADGSRDLDSIPMCMWFIMVTLTTVGYGDVTPQSELGKPFTMFCCFVGVCLVAMPLAVIGNNFVSVHNVYLNATAEKRRGVAEGGSPDRRSSGGGGFASPSFARRKIRNQNPTIGSESFARRKIKRGQAERVQPV